MQGIVDRVLDWVDRYPATTLILTVLVIFPAVLVFGMYGTSLGFWGTVAAILYGGVMGQVLNLMSPNATDPRPALALLAVIVWAMLYADRNRRKHR